MAASYWRRRFDGARRVLNSTLDGGQTQASERFTAPR
jgi:hypothetical protein